MPTTITQGVAGSTSGGDFTDEFKLSKGIEVIERKNSTGVTSVVKAINPTTEISIKGGGAPAITLGSAGIAVTALSGGALVVSKFEHTEKNSEFDDFDAAAKHFPSGAVSGAT